MPDMQETIGTIEAALGNADLSAGRIVSALVILLVGVGIHRLLLSLVSRAMKRSHLEDKVKKVIQGALSFVMWFVLTLVVLGCLNVEVSSLVALLSVAALAVSLAVQNLLSNIAGGLLLLSTKPYTIGDYIEIGSVAGTVLETGVFYTRLRTFDNKLIQVPNSQVTEEKIINYSAEKTRRVDIKVRVSYGAPAEKVKASILGMLKAHPMILADPEPAVRISGFYESSVEYFIRVWCGNADYWDVYFDVLEGVQAALDRDGIEMAYNRLNVHMLSEGKERSGS